MEIEEIESFQRFVDLSKTGEGMVFLGAGGDPKDWIKGISDFLKEKGASESGDPEKIFQSYHLGTSTGGRKDLLMFFKENPDIIMSRLAILRLGMQGCSWLSDFVVNYANHYNFSLAPEGKPSCKLIGEDGNVFNVIGRVSRSLKNAGLKERADDFVKRAFSAKSYDEVLSLAMDYVEVE